MSIQHDADTVDFDRSVAYWVDELRKIRAEKAKLAEAEDIARQHIEAALGDATIGYVNGVPAVRWSVVESERLDVKKAREVLPEQVLNLLMRKQTTRRFSLLDVDGGTL